jgi:FkbM family methyltransferase
MDISEYISRYKKAYTNYISVLFKMYRITKKTNNKEIPLIKCMIRNDKRIFEATPGFISAYSYLNSASLISEPIIRDIHVEGGKLCFRYREYRLKFEVGVMADIAGVFVKEQYDYLDVKDETVIDIGASIGDSPMYFVIKRAAKVIALEPYPYSFDLAKKNIESSQLSNKIILLNAGYGMDSKISIDTSFIPDNSSSLKERDGGPQVPIYSLKTLLSKYKIDNAILKMDCEGCEYNLLEEDNDTIRRFKMIQIEYHHGYHKLVERLRKCGFLVKYTKPQRTLFKLGEVQLGYIYAQLQPEIN